MPALDFRSLTEGFHGKLAGPVAGMPWVQWVITSQTLCDRQHDCLSCNFYDQLHKMECGDKQI